MSQSVTLNGSSFTIPDVGENDWGQNVTDFLVAIPGAVLQKSGGAFTLTAEVDFGATYGLKSAYFKSRTANPASAGAVRLAKTDVVSFRNNANGADLDVGIDAADALTFASNKVVTVAGAFTLVDYLAFANQKSVRLLEQTGNGTNYIGLSAPDAVTANVTLKLPDGAGSTGQVLSTDGVGALSWINAAGGGTINTGVQGRLAVYSAAGTTLDDVVTMTNTVSVAIAAHGQGSVYTIPDGGQATANFVITEGAQTINGAKSLSGVTTLSGSSTGIFVISNASTLKVDSTNALVSIGTATMTYPLYVSKSSAGANVTLAVENSESANGASHAQLYIITGGASGGDPFLTLYNGVQNYSIGLDNSDSDALCVTGASTLNGTNLLRLTTAGALTVASTLTVTAGGLTVTAGGVSLSADSLTIAKTTNQIILGTTNTVTISSTAPAASRTYTLPDAGGAASFVMTESAQTINGIKTLGSVLLVANGAVGTPSVAFSGQTNSGIYNISSGSHIFGVSVNGVETLRFTPTELQPSLRILGANGTVSAPAYSFSGDSDTGLYIIGANEVGITCGGALTIDISGAGIDLYVGVTASLKLRSTGVTIPVNGAELGVLSTYNSIALNSVGVMSNYITVQNSKTFTVDMSSCKCFLVQMSNGDGAIVITSYQTGTITLLGSTGIIVASSTPGAGQLGIFKSATNHTVSFKSGSSLASTAASMQLMFIGNAPSAATNWA